MRCPDLSALPIASNSNSGWPWDEQSLQLPERMTNGSPWPKISIVTPSYNQAQFLEETIRSVLLQGYPNLEYIIIDGGSTDGSVDVIRKYEPWLAYWVSEPDQGQAHAINKGFERTTGEIVAWLNSDDVYVPAVLPRAVECLTANPEAAVVFGQSVFIDAQGSVLGDYDSGPFELPDFLYYCRIPQPSSFIQKWAMEEVGYLDEKWFFIMDYDLWLRIGLRFPIRYYEEPWSYFRRHSQSKSTVHEVRRWVETIQVMQHLFDDGQVASKQQSFRESVVGHAHWHAGLANWQLGKEDTAREHIRHATILAPFWPLKKVSQNMIVTYASYTSYPLDWIYSFFALLPKLSIWLRLARSQAIGRYYSKRASRARSDRRAAELACNAIRFDPLWLFNRNIDYRLLRHLLGPRVTETLRLLISRDV